MEGHTCRLETYGLSEEADLRAEGMRLTNRNGHLGVAFQVKGLMDFDAEIAMPGRFSVYNALTAIAICRHFGVPVEAVKKALQASGKFIPWQVATISVEGEIID